MAPCGAGKSLVYEVTIDMIRQDSPKKVLLLCLPVNKIMEEKTGTSRLPTAYITMSGRVVIDSEEGDMDTDVRVTDELLEAILRGDYAILMGHAESWSPECSVRTDLIELLVRPFLNSAIGKISKERKNAAFM